MDSLSSFFIGIVVGLIFVTVLLSFTGDDTIWYKNGQIDALNGKIYYELQIQDNGTTEWIYNDASTND